MERTKTLLLDFSTTAPSEIYCDSFAGDMHSLVVELEVTPTPEEGEILLCSFLRDNVVVDTVVVKDNRLTVPYSVLKEPGQYTAAFALADMNSRITASVLLTVRVAEDRVVLAPTEDMEDQSLVCYILGQAAATARAATREELSGVTTRLDTLESDTRSEFYVMDQQDAALTARIDGLEGELSTLTEELKASGFKIEEAIYNINQQKLNSSAGSATLTSPTSSVCCVEPLAQWVRIGNLVIMTFGFYSSSYDEFELTGLPFSANSDGYAVSLHHVRLVKGDFVSVPDTVVDMCQTNNGTKNLTVRRQGVNGVLLAGTLVYFTDEE